MDDGRIDPARRASVPPDPLYLAPGGADPATVAQREHVVALVEELALTEARIAALHAHQVSVLSTLQVHPHVTTTGLDIADELAPRLRWTTFTTDRRLATAARVATCFPLLFEDLRGAEIDYHRLDVVVREGDLLDEDQARVLDAVLTGRLAGLTTAQIRHLARREIAVIDSQAVKERARRVIAERRIAYTALPDGQGLLEVLGPAPAVRAAYDHLHTLAHDTTHPANTTDPYADHPGHSSGHDPGPGSGAALNGSGEASTHDTRGIDARRFDVCIESLIAPLSTRPGAAAGTGPQITIAWPAAVGHDDLPAHLSGHGTVPAELVRHLLQHTGFRKAATHPTTGHVTATDGHLHPPGTLPDLTRDPPPAAGGEAALRLDQARTTTLTSRGAPEDLPCHTTAPTVSEVPAPAVEDDHEHRRIHSDPLDVPDEIAFADPGPGWSEELGGFDDGIDVEMPTGPDLSDLDAYVTRVLVGHDDPLVELTTTDEGTSTPSDPESTGPARCEVVDPANTAPAPPSPPAPQQRTPHTPTASAPPCAASSSSAPPPAPPPAAAHPPTAATSTTPPPTPTADPPAPATPHPSAATTTPPNTPPGPPPPPTTTPTTPPSPGSVPSATSTPSRPPPSSPRYPPPSPPTSHTAAPPHSPSSTTAPGAR